MRIGLTYLTWFWIGESVLFLFKRGSQNAPVMSDAFHVVMILWIRRDDLTKFALIFFFFIFTDTLMWDSPVTGLRTHTHISSQFGFFSICVLVRNTPRCPSSSALLWKWPLVDLESLGWRIPRVLWRLCPVNKQHFIDEQSLIFQRFRERTLIIHFQKVSVDLRSQHNSIDSLKFSHRGNVISTVTDIKDSRHDIMIFFALLNTLFIAVKTP